MDMIDAKTSITNMISTSIKLEDYLYMGKVESPEIMTIPQSHNLDIKQFRNIIVINDKDVINMDYIVHIECEKHDDYGFYMYIYLLRDKSYVSFSHITENSMNELVKIYCDYNMSNVKEKTNSL